jgi:hypothetical protein
MTKFWSCDRKSSRLNKIVLVNSSATTRRRKKLIKNNFSTRKFTLIRRLAKFFHYFVKTASCLATAELLVLPSNVISLLFS